MHHLYVYSGIPKRCSTRRASSSALTRTSTRFVTFAWYYRKLSNWTFTISCSFTESFLISSASHPFICFHKLWQMYLIGVEDNPFHLDWVTHSLGFVNIPTFLLRNSFFRFLNSELLILIFQFSLCLILTVLWFR